MIEKLMGIIEEFQSKTITVAFKTPQARKALFDKFKKHILSSQFLISKIEYGNRFYIALQTGAVIEFNVYETEQDARCGLRDYLFLDKEEIGNSKIVRNLITRTQIQYYEFTNV